MDFCKMKQKMDELRAQLRRTAEKFFKDNSRAIFDKYPNLASFSWNQYTPYFNDGEPCEFSADYEHLTINGMDSCDNRRLLENPDVHMECPCGRKYDETCEFCSKDGSKLDRVVKNGLPNFDQTEKDIVSFFGVLRR